MFPRGNVRLVMRIHYEIKFCFRILSHAIPTRFSEYVCSGGLFINLFMDGRISSKLCGRQ